MVETGWKNPLNVKQDARRILNNYHACYNFASLNNILKNDNTSAYIPTSGGIDSIRASPMIYAYNYNFNIPNNATITSINVYPVCEQGNGSKYGKVIKIKTLKLKTGSSTTDGGVGTNKASSTLLPIKTWTGDSFKVSGTGTTFWGLQKITPSIVNSTNFGMVFQVVGTKYKKWVMPRVARLMMNIEYTVPTTKTETKSEFSLSFTQNEGTLDVSKPDMGIDFIITYSHKGGSSETPTVNINSNDLLISDSKTRAYTVKKLKCNEDKTSKNYVSTVTIYPGSLIGSQTITVKYENMSKSFSFYVVNSQDSSITEEEKAKYIDKNRVCVISNSEFSQNYCKYNGSAIFIMTDYWKRFGNTFSNNTWDTSYCTGSNNVFCNGSGYDK